MQRLACLEQEGHAVPPCVVDVQRDGRKCGAQRVFGHSGVVQVAGQVGGAVLAGPAARVSYACVSGASASHPTVRCFHLSGWPMPHTTSWLQVCAHTCRGTGPLPRPPARWAPWTAAPSPFRCGWPHHPTRPGVRGARTVSTVRNEWHAGTPPGFLRARARTRLRRLTGGSMAKRATICSRWFWMTSRMMPYLWRT